MNQKRFKLGATKTFHVEILDDKMFKRFVQLDFTRIVSPNASATGVPTATFSSFASKRATLDLNAIGCFKSEHKHMRHISINTKQKLYGEFEEGIHVTNNTAIIIIIKYRFMDLYGTFVVFNKFHNNTKLESWEDGIQRTCSIRTNLPTLCRHFRESSTPSTSLHLRSSCLLLLLNLLPHEIVSKWQQLREAERGWTWLNNITTSPSWPSFCP